MLPTPTLVLISNRMHHHAYLLRRRGIKVIQGLRHGDDIDSIGPCAVDFDIQSGFRIGSLSHTIKYLQHHTNTQHLILYADKKALSSSAYRDCIEQCSEVDGPAGFRLLTHPFNVNPMPKKERYIQLMAFISLGMTNKQIANLLFLSEEAIKTSVCRMITAFGLNERPSPNARPLCALYGMRYLPEQIFEVYKQFGLSPDL